MSRSDWTIEKSVDGVWHAYRFVHPSGIERTIRMDIMAPASAIEQMIEDVTAGLEAMIRHERQRLQDARKAMGTPEQ